MLSQLLSFVLSPVVSLFRMTFFGPSIKISVEPQRRVRVRFDGESVDGIRQAILLRNIGRGEAAWCSPQVITVWHDGELIDGETSTLQWSSTESNAVFSQKRFPSGASFPVQVFGTDERTRTLQIKSEKERSRSGHVFRVSGRYTVDIRVQVDVWGKSKYVRLHSNFDSNTLNIEVAQLETTLRRPKALGVQETL